MERLKWILAREFDIKDLGLLRYFSGMEIVRCKKWILVSQRKYSLDLLKEISMIGCKLAETPIEPNHRLGFAPKCVLGGKGGYQRLVGKLIHHSHSQLNIAFVISGISQFILHVKNTFKAKYWALRYLKEALRKGFFFLVKKNKCMLRPLQMQTQIKKQSAQPDI